MKWIYLSLALVCESVGFATLKFSQGFTKTSPTVATVLVDLIALLFFVLALKKIEASFVYMIAAGVGTVLIVLTNVIVFKQTLNWIQIACIVLIIVGSVGLQSQGYTH
ncbi:MAG: multidrug efflux SMR transporter [Rhizobacter sp.]|nr:multidrug efflux SMR transporter [Ferruginibacter sp.]